MDVKEILKQHLSLFSTAPFLFVGSGVSRRYLKLETWGDLLKKFAEKTHRPYEYYFTSNNGSYPAIASNLAKEFHEIWWKDSVYEAHRGKYKEFCINDESALKIEISDYLSNIDISVEDNEELKEEIELLRDSKIDGIITTNWDLFLEEIFDDFKPYIGQSELIFSVPQGIGEIYKIHGSCSSPDTLILTEKDYRSFRERNPYLAAKLLTIFTEHPIIFIGYSLTDENVVDLIKSITNCLTNSNIEKLRDRLIFVKYDPGIVSETVEKSDLIVNNFQIPITTIRVKNFKSVFEALTQINRKFPAKLLRKLKEHVYDLVANEKTNGRLYVTDINEATQTDEVDIVFGVGAISKIKGIGYKSISRRDLFEDLMYENNLFDSSKLIEDTLPSFGSKTFIPIFKYLRENDFFDKENKIIVDTIDLTDERNLRFVKKINQIINEGMVYFYPPVGYMKKRAYFQGQAESVQEYIDNNSFKEFLKYYSLFDEKHITPEKLRLVICENFNGQIYQGSMNTFEYTQFVKLMCLYDYLKHYKSFTVQAVGDI